MSYPKISVIVPSYNQGHFIRETIESILNQQYPNLELIVIDGGSTDDTVKILKSFDDKIDYWISEKDRGQSHAINKALAVATGEFIGWQNSDDIYLPGALYALAQKAMEGYDVVYSSILGIDAASKELTRIYFVPFSRRLLQYYSIAFSNQAALYRANVLKKIKVSEQYHYAMDFDLEFNLSNYGCSFGFVKGIWGAIRFHADAKTVNEFYGKSKKEEVTIRQKNGINQDPSKPLAAQFPLQWLSCIFYIAWYRLWFGGLFYKIKKKFNRNNPELFKPLAS